MSEQGPDQAAEKVDLTPGMRMALDLGPLLVFFTAYMAGDLFVATGAFMAATLVAVVIYKVRAGKVPLNLIVIATVVSIFGGLTLWLNDDHFIKIRPTIVSLLFASVLFIGHVLGRPFLKIVFEAAFPPMEQEGWRRLNLRWAWFFVFMAVLNEVIWRNFSEEFWVSFGVFGEIPITIVFALAQFPLIQRYMIEEGDEDEDEEYEDSETA